MDVRAPVTSPFSKSPRTRVARGKVVNRVSDGPVDWTCDMGRMGWDQGLETGAELGVMGNLSGVRY